MARITGLSHVAIKSDRFEETLRFYKDGLGLFLVQQTKDSAVLRVPDGTVIEVFAGGEPSRNTAGITHFCFNAHNLKAVMERAVCFGAVVKTQPYPLGELNIGFVIAPTGEEVEFWDIAAFGDEPPCDEQGCYIKTMVHPAFTVENLAASKAFYEALGIRPKVDWGWGCSMLMDDNREIELFSGGHVCNNTGGITHVCFLTDHLEETLEAAVSAGGVLTDAPAAFENVRYAFFRGLSGEMVELFEMDPDKEAGMFAVPQPGPAIK